MKKITVYVIVGGFFLSMAWAGSAQQKEAIRIIMVEKLNKSKTVLEGIALGDFGKISANAEKLIELTKTEEWFTYKTPRYDLNTHEFRRAAENLIDRAKAKNLDGVTLAYFDLTMSCVRCHKYVRELGDARLEVPGRFHAAKN